MLQVGMERHFATSEFVNPHRYARSLKMTSVQRDLIDKDPNGQIGWLYFGKSEDAFDDNTAYLGAFNGHVNGVCMMKEIHR